MSEIITIYNQLVDHRIHILLPDGSTVYWMSITIQHILASKDPIFVGKSAFDLRTHILDIYPIGYEDKLMQRVSLSPKLLGVIPQPSPYQLLNENVIELEMQQGEKTHLMLQDYFNGENTFYALDVPKEQSTYVNVSLDFSLTDSFKGFM